MKRYIAIDTSNWPDKTAIHVLKSKTTRDGNEVSGGYTVEYSTVVNSNNMDEVSAIVEKVKNVYKISDRQVFRRNSKENLGVTEYEQLRTRTDL